MAASKEVVVAAQVPGWALARDIPSAAIGLGPAGAAPAAFTRVRIIYNGKVGGREEWELDEEVRYTDPTLACTLIATKGYKFDLASVPRPLWSLIAPFQLSILAPLFHDLIYDRKGVMKEGDVIPFPRRPDFTQRDADDLFYRLMEAEGVDYWRRQLAYFAVRAAGWTYWNT